VRIIRSTNVARLVRRVIRIAVVHGDILVLDGRILEAVVLGMVARLRVSISTDDNVQINVQYGHDNPESAHDTDIHPREDVTKGFAL